MLVQRVEKHIIKPSNIHYAMLDKFCFLSKNLYNHANYILRQGFINNGSVASYGDLDKILKADVGYPDYRAMPTAQSAQQALRLLDKNWKPFFKAVKDWSKNKGKYTGKPRLPKYKKKDGRNILILTNQNVKLKEGVLKFPKKFEGFELKLKCWKRDGFHGFNQIRFIPRQGYMIAEAVYSVSICDEKKGYGKMNNCVFTIKDIVSLVRPVAEKYGVKAIYLFGSYARGEADGNSDLDFLVFGGEGFKLTMVFALAEELRSILKKNVDVFEISEIDKGSDFYNTIMKERLFVA